MPFNCLYSRLGPDTVAMSPMYQLRLRFSLRLCGKSYIERILISIRAIETNPVRTFFDKRLCVLYSSHTGFGPMMSRPAGRLGRGSFAHNVLEVTRFCWAFRSEATWGSPRPLLCDVARGSRRNCHCPK